MLTTLTSLNQIEDLQLKMQTELKKCKQELQLRRKTIEKLHEIKEADEWKLLSLEHHHHLHPDDPKYQRLQEEKNTLEKGFNNAMKTIIQIMDEEKKSFIK